MVPKIWDAILFISSSPLRNSNNSCHLYLITFMGVIEEGRVREIGTIQISGRSSLGQVGPVIGGPERLQRWLSYKYKTPEVGYNISGPHQMMWMMMHQ